MSAVVEFRSVTGDLVTSSSVPDGRTIGYSIPDGATHVTVRDLGHSLDLGDVIERIAGRPQPHNGQRLDEYMLDRLARIEVEAAATYAQHRAEIEARLANVERLVGVRFGR